ncbi:MAG TPA: SUF system NifU family Fe-S cluster assembly protein [Candidatus Izemoplasmatales bacterium]|nr:SUF system NifU family Fe-S cluster assembly protein [Candidatus Izemoplasmatales bacterium]
MTRLDNLYREVIMEHYKNPRNKGLVGGEGFMVTHIKNPSCGDDITVETKVENGIVKACHHEGTGCSICCASASVMTEIMTGKKLEEAKNVADNYLKMIHNEPFDESVDFEEAEAFSGVRQFPARTKCASIAWQAFQNTVKKE